MANPIASGTFTKAFLQAAVQSRQPQSGGVAEPSDVSASIVAIHGDPHYRVLFNVSSFLATVEVLLPDTVTGMSNWFTAVSYTAV